jgi:hypothetical protein
MVLDSADVGAGAGLKNGPYRFGYLRTAPGGSSVPAILAMPTKSCPKCQGRDPHKLITLSELSWAVDYFRCPSCAHIWTVTKDGTQLVAHITLQETKD